MNKFDIIVIGAGLSGIGAASYIQKFCPSKSLCVLEMRDAIGGTWDLFRYPGVRSDSDMYTLGHKYHPWLGENAIADGPSILKYINDIADTHNIIDNIHLRRKVISLDWCSETALWTITTESTDTSEPIEYQARFILSCSGYYDYEKGYTPKFKGIDDFKGEIIHPQFWPEKFDYTDKNIVIIGSGATAVTLLPSLAEKAAKVTMLQRSPTYILSRESHDSFARFLRIFLPEMPAYRLARWKNIAMSMFIFKFSIRFPNTVKNLLAKMAAAYLGEQYDAKHFSPSYNPWEERLCLVPNGNLFMAIRSGKADIVTDHIETFTKDGIALKSRKLLKADVIITATGLNIKIMSDAKLSIDGKSRAIPEHYIYRGALLSDIPNLAFITGYTNASWTLKANLINEYFCRLINYMDKHNYKQCIAKLDSEITEGESIINLKSGYFTRSLDQFPKQGTKKPWLNNQNYIKDVVNFRFSRLKNKHLNFI